MMMIVQLMTADIFLASKVNIYSSNSEDEVSEDEERNRKRLLKAKKLDSDKVIVYGNIHLRNVFWILSLVYNHCLQFVAKLQMNSCLELSIFFLPLPFVTEKMPTTFVNSSESDCHITLNDTLNARLKSSFGAGTETLSPSCLKYAKCTHISMAKIALDWTILMQV